MILNKKWIDCWTFFLFVACIQFGTPVRSQNHEPKNPESYFPYSFGY